MLHFTDLSPRFARRDVTRYKVESFGEDNLYPQTVNLVVQNSGRAVSCVNKFSEFIEGKGFVDQVFASAHVNGNEETADALLSSAAEDFALHGGFAVLVKYNAFGEKVEAYHVPFEHVRKGIKARDGELAVSAKWSASRIKETDIDWYKPFNEKTVLTEMAAAGGVLHYGGQLAYFSARGKNEYGLAPIDAELESAVSDGQIKLSHYSSLITAFMDNVLITLRHQLTDEQSKSLNDTLANYQGAENSGALLVLDGIDPDDMVVNSLNSKKSENAHTATEASIHERLRLLFGIPRILLSDDSRGGLSDQGNLLGLAKLFYSEITGKPRKKVETLMAKIFGGNWYYNINPSENYTIEPIAQADTNKIEQ